LSQSDGEHLAPECSVYGCEEQFPLWFYKPTTAGNKGWNVFNVLRNFGGHNGIEWLLLFSSRSDG
jgi:hypothetical protein